MLACFSVFYSDAILSLWSEWVSEGSAYSHGPLIFVVSLYLVWVKRYEILKITPTSSVLLASGLILASAPIWVVASVLSIETLKHVYIVIMIALLVWGVAGLRVAWAVIFPISYLFFSVPIWAALEPVLQNITAWSSGVVLSLIGVPVLVEGLFLSIPAGVFEVEGGCSGVNYLISGLALSVFYTFISYRSYWKRVVFISAAVILTIVGNIVRVVIIIIAGHMTDMQHSFITDHSAMGWWVFLLIMIPLYVIGFKYQDPEPSVWSAGHQSPGFPVSFPHGALLISVLPLVLVLAVAPLMANKVKELMGHDYVAQEGMTLNFDSTKWGLVSSPGLLDWQPGFAEGDMSLFQSFKGADSSKLFSYFSYYARQDGSKELTAGDNDLADGVVWFSKIGSSERVIDRAGSVGQVREAYLVDKTGRKELLVWYWYSVAGYTTVDRKKAKLLEFYKLVEPNKGSALMAVGIDVIDGDLDKARYQLGTFQEKVSPGMQKYINKLGIH